MVGANGFEAATFSIAFKYRAHAPGAPSRPATAEAALALKLAVDARNPAPSTPGAPLQVCRQSYGLFGVLSTISSFLTSNDPGTCRAFISASVLSPALSTTPIRVTRMFLTMT
jgi:hypothetical protein